MTGRLADKIALITGGGSGIGRACARRFSQEGAKVCVADLDLAAAAETARLVDPAGKTAIAVQIDTTDESANDAMVGRCVEAFGALDILVAAAGIASPLRPGEGPVQPHTVLTVPTEQFRQVLEINLYGVMFSNRAVARWMVANQVGAASSTSRRSCPRCRRPAGPTA